MPEDEGGCVCPGEEHGEPKSPLSSCLPFQIPAVGKRVLPLEVTQSSQHQRSTTLRTHGTTRCWREELHAGLLAPEN